MSGADVLSQSEIDQLLSALSTGVVSAEEMKVEEKQKKVKVYDFKRPDKFSKDQIRTLYMLHENFARLLNTYLSTNLRTLVNISVASVEQLAYEEFIRSLSNPSVIGIFNMSPLKGNVIFEINPNIAFSIIDRLFGGEGTVINKIRTLTDIEETIIRKVITKSLDNLQEAWRHVVNTEPRLEVIETNPQFTQIVPPNDMVVIVTLQTQIGQVEGLINICIPYLVLEPIMSKLTTTFWVASSIAKQAHPEQVDILEKKIKKTYVPLAVELGTINLSVRELLSLNINDVLKLDTTVGSELKVIVGRKAKFLCHPGTANKKVAVQISGVNIEGDDEDE
ncbi:MAG: flagellar motor switch protein FliM [Negativicutes bacterium]|nr:flagellar motor switch protein FliM [Negativicutes bacterium]MBP9537280.1 flagellar motor switch protein FliM [Negativicutes bacterium]MBP9948658.1 flagellar motor switch protein FliM [Negativicutes bacterium]